MTQRSRPDEHVVVSNLSNSDISTDSVAEPAREEEKLNHKHMHSTSAHMRTGVHAPAPPSTHAFPPAPHTHHQHICMHTEGALARTHKEGLVQKR